MPGEFILYETIVLEKENILQNLNFRPTLNTREKVKLENIKLLKDFLTL